MLNLKRTILGTIGVVVLLIVGFSIADNGSEPSDSSGDLAGLDQNNAKNEGNSRSLAPDFKLLNTEGHVVSLTDFEGKIIILNFWATWCGPCRAEIPGLVKLQDKYREDLVVIGISVDRETRDQVPSFMEKYGINYPVLYSDGRVERDYGGIRGIPTTFVIDRSLRVYRQYVGYRPESVFEEDIRALM